MASPRAYSQPLHKAMLSGNVELLQNISEKYSLDLPTLTETMCLLSNYSRQNCHITPLQAAVMTGDYHLCKRLIFEGAKFLSLSYYMMHPLNMALDYRKFQIAKLLIGCGADVSLVQHEYYPMYYAIKPLTPDYIVEAIIKGGFSPDAVVENVHHSTALHRAVDCNNEPVVKILMKYNADCDIKDLYGFTAMHIAVNQRLEAMVKLLAENGAQSDIECKEGYTSLFHAVRVNDQACLQVLLKHGADIHHLSSTKQIYPLNFAVWLSRKEITEALLKQGADVQMVSPGTGDSPLHSAAMSQRGKGSEEALEDLMSIVRCLIEGGAEIDCPNKHGYSPMQLAIKEENFRIVQLLVEEGCSVNQRLDQETNLHFISKFATKDVVKTFLEHGADYSVLDNNGVTPYHSSMLNSDPNVMKLFWKFFCPWDLPLPDDSRRPLSHPSIEKALENQKKFMSGILENDITMMGVALDDGAEVKGCSTKMPYPLHYAAVSGFDVAVRMMLDKGFPANRLNDRGETALHLAASEGNHRICLHLLRYGASYNAPSKSTGNTPMDLAVISNHHSVTCILIKIYKLFHCNNEKVIVNELKNPVNSDLVLTVINSVNRKGNTLLSEALSKGCSELASCIMNFRVHMSQEDF